MRRLDGKVKLPDFYHHSIPCPVHPKSTSFRGTKTCRECLSEYKRLVRERFGIPAKHTFLRDRAAAKRRGLPWELSFEQWLNIIQQPCVYGGAQGGLSDLRRGVDRRDNTVGYTVENSQACCCRHNRFKSDILTHEQMLDASSRYGIACGNAAPRRRRKRDNKTAN